MKYENIDEANKLVNEINELDAALDMLSYDSKNNNKIFIAEHSSICHTGVELEIRKYPNLKKVLEDSISKEIEKKKSELEKL